jgi:putative transposase
MNRKVVLSVGEFYHIYNRGVEKKQIFLDKYDYDRFVTLLLLTNLPGALDIREFERLKKHKKGGTLVKKEQQTLVDIGAYCLMPNHFHLLVYEKTEGGITKFMHKLTTAYTMYFNKKYERVGPLLQGTFKSEHADSDDYLKYLFSYIHLNPLKIFNKNWRESCKSDSVSKKSFLDNYVYSSYLDYSGSNREDGAILCTSSFPDYFYDSEDFKSNLFDWFEEFDLC